MIRVAAFLAAILPPAAVSAAPAEDPRWIQVAGNDQGPIYLDNQSIERAGNIVTAWYRTDLAQPGSHGEIQWMDRREIDCATRTIRLVAFYELQPDGSKGLTNDKVDRAAEAIIPGSVADATARYVCQG